MTTEDDNKALVVEFCRAFTAGEWDVLANLLADDFTWRQPSSQLRQSDAVQGASLLNADPGWSKSDALAIYRSTREGAVDQKFDLTPLTMTAEDERVAVEATSSAVNANNGRIYDNRYHHLFVCREGTIVELREYQDTLHVFDVWMAP